MSEQTHLGADRETLARQYLRKASELREHQTTVAMTSGGTESLAAADTACRWGSDYGVEIDVVVHVNTGAGMSVTRDAVQKFCAERGLSYVEGLNQKDGEMLAHRVLSNGWPSSSRGSRADQTGHWREWVMRKDRVFDGVYRSFSKPQLWIAGIRYLESDQRASISGEDPVYIPDRRPNRTWLNPIHAWTDREVECHIDEHDIPRTPAYDWIGHSGDCLGCSFDEPTVVNEVEIIEPELAFAMRLLSAWAFLAIKAGELDVPIHRAVWGWPPSLESGERASGELADDSMQAEIDATCEGCEDACYTRSDSFWERPAVADGGDRP